MPAESDEPLRKVTLNLFREDVEFMILKYGHGWTKEVRNLVRRHRLQTAYAKKVHDAQRN